MIVKISKSLIKTIRNFRFNDWRENVSDNDIKSKIRYLLISDQIISQHDQISWEIINKKFQGVYIPSQNKVVHFAQMMTVDGKARSRNTFLSQNVVTSHKFASENNASLSVSINPYDLGKSIPQAKFIRNSIDELFILGIQINNSLTTNELNFSSLEEFIRKRESLRERNNGNSSTLIQYIREQQNVVIYGRLDGANAPDTYNICNIIKLLCSGRRIFIHFYDVTPVGNNRRNWILEKISEIVDYVGNTTENERALIHDLENTIEMTDQILQRNQATFKANIIRKYINVEGFDIHKCFACGYIVESNFIGSHIYRYADIKRDYQNRLITAEQAAHLIVSGDNGFLLCPTQDKEFENGQIYFDLTQKKFVANRRRTSSEEQYLQIKNNINSNNFENIIFSDEFVSNVQKHMQRISSN